MSKEDSAKRYCVGDQEKDIALVATNLFLLSFVFLQCIHQLQPWPHSVAIFCPGYECPKDKEMITNIFEFRESSPVHEG